MDQGDTLSRYARQEILPQIGTSGQARLGAAHVTVIGAGGLAATALPLLAGAGVGRVTIVDGDVVDLSNLHRQHLFNEADTGTSKAKVAASRCRAINSEIYMSALNEKLTPENAEAIVNKSDLVLDCADSFAVSYTLSDVCFTRKIPLITGSALALSGYAAGVCGVAPSLRAVFPDAPENAANCATAGVMGPIVSMIGALQAQMALAALLDLKPRPLGQMVQMDATSYRSTSFRFDGVSEPDEFFRFESARSLRNTDTIIELRDEIEAPEPAHAHALRMGVDDILTLPKQGRLALCCATGLRSWRAAEKLKPIWPGEIVLVAASAS